MARSGPLLATLINNKKPFLHNYLFSSSNAFGGRPLFGMTFLSLDSVEVMVLNTSTKDGDTYNKKELLVFYKVCC